VPKSETDREQEAFQLAEKLFFTLEKDGGRYRLQRKIGDRPERENLTLDQVEEVLERWKLEGPHGG
jgi:hypothetical protein